MEKELELDIKFEFSKAAIFCRNKKRVLHSLSLQPTASDTIQEEFLKEMRYVKDDTEQIRSWKKRIIVLAGCTVVDFEEDNKDDQEPLPISKEQESLQDVADSSDEDGCVGE
ncbi:hypothetical protein FQA39_LY04713 [Lamprigera yunnana]|nr:hypothetical protein FQA39_LY04713 [Lamprigera yunnana]